MTAKVRNDPLVDSVMDRIKETFLNSGVEEFIVDRLKQLWLSNIEDNAKIHIEKTADAGTSAGTAKKKGYTELEIQPEQPKHLVQKLKHLKQKRPNKAPRQKKFSQSSVPDKHMSARGTGIEHQESAGLDVQRPDVQITMRKCSIRLKRLIIPLEVILSQKTGLEQSKPVPRGVKKTGKPKLAERMRVSEQLQASSEQGLKQSKPVSRGMKKARKPKSRGRPRASSERLQASSVHLQPSEVEQRQAFVELQASSQQPIPQLDGITDSSYEMERGDERIYDASCPDESDYQDPDELQVPSLSFDEDEEMLCSDDDIEYDTESLFGGVNVMVCQYDQIHMTKNSWKFKLKNGVLSTNGEEYMFSRAEGSAGW